MDSNDEKAQIKKRQNAERARRYRTRKKLEKEQQRAANLDGEALIPATLSDSNDEKAQIKKRQNAERARRNRARKKLEKEQKRIAALNGELWYQRQCRIAMTSNPALIGLSPATLNKRKLICENHFRKEDILPSGRLMTGTVPISCDSCNTSSQSNVEGNVSPPNLTLNQSILFHPRRYPGPANVSPNNECHQMEFEDSFIDEQVSSETSMTYDKYQRSPAENVKTEKLDNTSPTQNVGSSPTAQLQGLHTDCTLGTTDSLDLDSKDIRADDIYNIFDINPTQTRIQILRPSSNKDPILSEVEQKLRIHYLKTMIKNENEISNLKIEANRLQIMKEKTEIENNKEAHLQRMENLKLENEFWKLLLQNRIK